MVYDAYHVSYRDENGVTVHTDEVLYRQGDTEIPYTVQHTYTPYYVTGSDEEDEEKAANFDGWNVVDITTDPETLGNVYQSYLMISKAHDGQIPVDRTSFMSKIENDSKLSPIVEIYNKFVFSSGQ